MTRIRTAAVATLLTSFVALQPVTALAGDNDRRSRRDRIEDRWDRREDRRDRREDRWDRREDRRDRREDRWDRREDRWDRRDDRYRGRRNQWDPARYYRSGPPRRLGRYDRIYRGSDNRYYCKRDDGTTGLIIGGMAGGVLGNIIAPGGSKTLGAILGAGAGALIGRAIDDGDVVCR